MNILQFWVLFCLLILLSSFNLFVINFVWSYWNSILEKQRSHIVFVVMFTLTTIFLWYELFKYYPVSIGYI